ncbi:MAG: phage head closure protein [Clostridia bacterium]
MMIGKLNRRIQVLKHIETQDEFGQSVVSWEVVARAWANIVPKSGGEIFNFQRIMTKSDVVITMRYDKEITVQHRVKYLDKTYEIVAVQDENTSHKATVLYCKEANENEL